MAIESNRDLPLVSLNLNDIETLFDYISQRVKNGRPKAPVVLSVAINTVTFDSLDKAKQFIKHYDSTYGGEGKSFAEKIHTLKLEAKCYDHDLTDYRMRGYRDIEVTVEENKVHTMVYCQDNVSTYRPTTWVTQESKALEGFLLQFSKPAQLPISRIVGLSGSGLTIAGGLAAGILLNPILIPIAVFGAGMALLTMKFSKGEITNNINFLPAPERNTDVLVNVVR